MNPLLYDWVHFEFVLVDRILLNLEWFNDSPVNVFLSFINSFDPVAAWFQTHFKRSVVINLDWISIKVLCVVGHDFGVNTGYWVTKDFVCKLAFDSLLDSAARDDSQARCHYEKVVSFHAIPPNNYSILQLSYIKVFVEC